MRTALAEWKQSRNQPNVAFNGYIQTDHYQMRTFFDHYIITMYVCKITNRGVKSLHY